MKGLLISPDTQSIEVIEITDQDDIVKLIGFDTIISHRSGETEDHTIVTDGKNVWSFSPHNNLVIIDIVKEGEK